MKRCGSYRFRRRNFPRARHGFAQSLFHLQRVLVASGRLLAQASHHNVGNPLRDFEIQVAGCFGNGEELLFHDGRNAVGPEWADTGQHFVENDGYGIDVGAFTMATIQLLWGHVLGRSQGGAGLSQSPGRSQIGDGKVG